METEIEEKVDCILVKDLMKNYYIDDTNNLVFCNDGKFIFKCKECEEHIFFKKYISCEIGSWVDGNPTKWLTKRKYRFSNKDIFDTIDYYKWGWFRYPEYIKLLPSNYMLHNFKDKDNNKWIVFDGEKTILIIYNYLKKNNDEDFLNVMIPVIYDVN